MFATHVRTQRRSFATARSIAKLKPPLCSVESKLPIGVKIPFSTKCGEWVIYAEPVTYTKLTVSWIRGRQHNYLIDNYTTLPNTTHTLIWASSVTVPGNDLTTHNYIPHSCMQVQHIHNHILAQLRGHSHYVLRGQFPETNLPLLLMSVYIPMEHIQ